jgi:hypothetical protein
MARNARLKNRAASDSKETDGAYKTDGTDGISPQHVPIGLIRPIRAISELL